MYHFGKKKILIRVFQLVQVGRRVFEYFIRFVMRIGIFIFRV